MGILPDNQVLDLLDYALSANTVNTVRTLRDLLASGVEPLVLVSQLGGLITDILVGSLEVDRDERREGFFNRSLCKCCFCELSRSPMDSRCAFFWGGGIT